MVLSDTSELLCKTNSMIHHSILSKLRTLRKKILFLTLEYLENQYF